MTLDLDPGISTGSQGVPAIKKDKTDYIIRKVIQALTILEQFQDDVDELSITQLSRRLCVNEKYVGVLLGTLQARNYIERNNATNHYRLGFKTLELGQAVLRQMTLHRVAHPVLVDVFSRCGETTAVAVLRKSRVIELDAIPSEHPVQVVSRVGVHLPVHCTAAGKALLACQEAYELEKLLQGMELKSLTAQTITSARELGRELERILKDGYAVDDQETDREVRAVAAVIRDYAGVVVGSLVVTGPSCRLSMERIKADLAPLVVEAAREISTRLGFHCAGKEEAVQVTASKTKSVRKRSRSSEPGPVG